MKTNNYNLRTTGLMTLVALLMTTALLFAQVPQKMSYQAVVRDASGNLVTNQEVGMKVSILRGSETGSVVYQEIYNPNPKTNANGLISLQIGSGIVISGDFSTIDWGADSYFVKTETDPAGGTSYSIAGTSELLSVPYALRAGGPQIVIDDWKNVSSFDHLGGVGSTRLIGEIPGEKSWKTASIGYGNLIGSEDVVTVYVKMIKRSGEASLTKAVPFDMELENGMVVTFRNWVYDSGSLYYILALRDGDIREFENFDFNAWQTQHQVQWKYVITKK